MEQLSIEPFLEADNRFLLFIARTESLESVMERENHGVSQIQSTIK